MKIILPKQLQEMSLRENKKLKRGLDLLAQAIRENDLPRQEGILAEYNLRVKHEKWNTSDFGTGSIYQ